MTASLVMGTAQLGSAYGVNNQEGELSLQAAFKVLDAAWEGEVRILDTAEAYGSSQEVIGAYLADHPNRRFAICSKLSTSLDSSSAELDCELDRRIKASLDTLGCDSLFVYYLHSFEMCKDEILMSALREQAESPSVNSIGVSIYEPEELEYLIERRQGSVSAVQIPFNAFNCAQWTKNSLLSRAVEAGFTVFTRSVYLQGLVFKNPEDPLVVTLGLDSVLEAFLSKAAATGISRSQLACDFVRSFEEVSYVILGCETPQQAQENAAMFVVDPSSWSQSSLVCQIKQSARIPQRVLDPRLWILE